jgi:hypothetical protein
MGVKSKGGVKVVKGSQIKMYFKALINEIREG